MDNHYWETRTGDNTFIPENANDKSKINFQFWLFPQILKVQVWTGKIKVNRSKVLWTFIGTR